MHSNKLYTALQHVISNSPDNVHQVTNELFYATTEDPLALEIETSFFNMVVRHVYNPLLALADLPVYKDTISQSEIDMIESMTPSKLAAYQMYWWEAARVDAQLLLNILVTFIQPA